MTDTCQCTDIAGLINELADIRDQLVKLRKQYESDLYEMQPYINAIRRGARIDIEYPAPDATYCGTPEEFRTLNPAHYSPRGYGVIP